MKADDLKLIVAVNQFCTIQRAAEALYISQPAVSQRLQQIERYWGEPLFVRTARKMVLTPAGEEVLAFAKHYLAEELVVKQRIEALKEEVSGTITIGVSSVIGQYIMPQLLKTFMTSYPAVRVEVTVGLSDNVLQGNYHVKLTRGQRPDAKNTYHLFDAPLYYVEINERSDARPFIEHQSDSSYHVDINQWLKGRFLENTLATIKVDQIETCKQMVSHGVGRSVLPETVIKDFDQSKFIIEPIVLANRPVKRSNWLTIGEGADTLPQVNAFQALVQKNFLNDLLKRH
ncbi:DNA-binding transcriptional regulator, LysR family [Amphibacillus marinus]|uniref:DNA-binding transcriptional regulator, LysR family n=1 Tax=Amphibacillus marinus TaxID=872970 RepID=A0A1H8JUB2_9BACI|nr:LysR family transcriptional regulator [Amphibacillus marinus]SEN83788.1 DNA-binding transcriptional regulator, LysR family [Amphibacillus marinus]